MPIYEYRCPKCGQEFEELVRSTASADRVACPRCHAPGARRKLSVFAAHQGSAAPADDRSANPCTCCGEADGPCHLPGQ